MTTVSSPIRTLDRPSKRQRRDVLDAVIERAQGKCVNPTDTSEVLAQLEALAHEEYPPLLMALKAGIAYVKNRVKLTLTRDALHKRLHSKKRK